MSVKFPLHVSYFLLLSLLRFSLASDCKQCISEFAEKGGCDCMQNESCDVTALIPEGCFPCEDKAMAYCFPEAGKNIFFVSINR